jgi:hypothetical protein
VSSPLFINVDRAGSRPADGELMLAPWSISAHMSDNQPKRDLSALALT